MATILTTDADVARHVVAELERLHARLDGIENHLYQLPVPAAEELEPFVDLAAEAIAAAADTVAAAADTVADAAATVADAAETVAAAADTDDVAEEESAEAVDTGPVEDVDTDPDPDPDPVPDPPAAPRRHGPFRRG
jgi:methyl-accepting chemotaxis protein